MNVLSYAVLVAFAALTPGGEMKQSARPGVQLLLSVEKTSVKAGEPISLTVAIVNGSNGPVSVKSFAPRGKERSTRRLHPIWFRLVSGAGEPQLSAGSVGRPPRGSLTSYVVLAPRQKKSYSYLLEDYVGAPPGIYSLRASYYDGNEEESNEIRDRGVGLLEAAPVTVTIVP
jgi:hypothetical protein